MKQNMPLNPLNHITALLFIVVVSAVMARISCAMNTTLYLFPISQLAIAILYTLLLLIAVIPIRGKKGYKAFKVYSVICCLLYFYLYTLYEFQTYSHDDSKTLTFTECIAMRFRVINTTSIEAYSFSGIKDAAQTILQGPQKASNFSFIGWLFFFCDFIFIPLLVFSIAYISIKPAPAESKKSKEYSSFFRDENGSIVTPFHSEKDYIHHQNRNSI